MSKRVARKGKTRQRKSNKKVVAILCSLLILTLAIGIMGEWRMRFGLYKPPASGPPQSGNSNPSKEYIYSGGRLIATEEPAAFTSSAPTNLVAATRAGALVVDITWNPVPGAQYYRIERSPSKDASYTAISTNTIQASMADSTTTGGLAYLYKACVADNQGNCISAYSNIDSATAVVFADDPLLDPQTTAGTTVQATHITQLRAAINALRITAGIGAASWDQTHPVAEGQPVYASHITEMRARLDEARNALNACCGVSLPSQAYTDPNLTGANIYGIRRAHIRDLRDRVK